MIKIIHTNDIHGKLEKDEKTKVDISKFSAKIEEIRKEHSTLLLDAVDTIHGQPIVSISEGKAMIDIMNEMKYDAMVPGNHDFNYGRERLQELAELAEFPIISANIYDEQGDRLLAPYTLKEIDGVKFGIFGITTPETIHKARPEDIEGLRFEDTVLESRKMVSILKDQERADVIIALVHLGIDKSTMPEHRSDTLAASVEGIDLVVDGHSHTELKASRLIGETPIVQAGDYMRCIGMVNFIKKACGEAGISSELIYREDIKGIKEDLSISRILIRVDEENNRSTSEIVSAFPFDNYVITKEVSGKDIVKALEHGLSFYPEPSSAFPHVGGITFKLDRLKAPGKRVYDVFIAGERLEEKKYYKLATNDFLASGGDSYDMFKTAKMTGRYSSIDEVLSNYIKNRHILESEADTNRDKYDIRIVI